MRKVANVQGDLYFFNAGRSTIANDGESNIMLRDIEEMIELLPRSLKVPFRMHVDGYKYREIAEQLQVPIGTIKSRMFFAKKELRALVRNRYQFAQPKSA